VDIPRLRLQKLKSPALYSHAKGARVEFLEYQHQFGRYPNPFQGCPYTPNSVDRGARASVFFFLNVCIGHGRGVMQSFCGYIASFGNGFPVWGSGVLSLVLSTNVFMTCILLVRL